MIPSMSEKLEARAGTPEAALLQDRVDQLVRAHRVRGHMIARIDPLGTARPGLPELDPAFFGLQDEHMDLPVSSGTMQWEGTPTLRRILERLRNTYCRYIGVQYMHIHDLEARRWLRDRMEGTENRLALSREEQLRILTRLTDATIFEEFLQKKYPGAKTFSLEGAESLIPLLDLAIERAAAQGIDEIVLAMAHRGRLNVLANILGKSPREIFREFEDVDAHVHRGRGDVKHHLGHSADWTTQDGRRVHLSLCFNPSHLEFVNPVALGRVRAKQDRTGDTARARGMTLLIHGEAAFAGEGVTQETLNLSELATYRTGGTIHVIVNNQVGFTTPPSEGRSSVYASDVGKMLQIPIFLVNGEDPEAVAQVVALSMDFRKTFGRDVVIDMYAYRRRGHNEGDEPAFTQPLMYRAIEARRSVRESYLGHLTKLGGVTLEEGEKIAEERRAALQKSFDEARSPEYSDAVSAPTGIWRRYQGGPEGAAEPAATAVERGRLAGFLRSLTVVPAGFHVHPKIERGLAHRREMAEGKRPLDWAAGEALALASLAADGVRIRLTGQDTARGTFSQRHARLHDVENGSTWSPFSALAPDQGPVEIENSPLSEVGALGYEYGYSLEYPEALVAWEAQFGDFVNAAQVIVDQFIVSAEQKWHRLSGLVLLLPHGFEGMGPEHSSARLERFLALGVDNNIQVANPTTPAQYFHLLRRQVVRRWRKPLIVMTPKSLLRHPRAVSTLDECANGSFRSVIADESARVAACRRVLLCSGKIYYDLAKHREDEQRDDVAIVRVEELYPTPAEELRAALGPFRDGTPVLWVQEEPENMGASHHMRLSFGETLFARMPFSVISRAASSSPATGSASSHRLEQAEIVARAFTE
jgi:2-oxoglutarate dehydrogenase E1 component